MGRVRDFFRARRQPKFTPAPLPSQIARAAADAPRSVKRSHKLAVRRQYRVRALTMDSRFRQIACEEAASRLSSQVEAAIEADRGFHATPELSSALQR